MRKLKGLIAIMLLVTCCLTTLADGALMDSGQDTIDLTKGVTATGKVTTDNPTYVTVTGAKIIKQEPAGIAKLSVNVSASGATFTITFTNPGTVEVEGTYSYADGTPSGEIPTETATCTAEKFPRFFFALCVRPVGPYYAPTKILGISVPKFIQDQVNAIIPDHYDIQVKKTELVGDTITNRGFYAVSFNNAIIEYTKTLVHDFFAKVGLNLFPAATGWVTGKVMNKPASGTLMEIVEKKYDKIYTNITTSTASKYHLVNYNCTHWATDQY